MIAEGTLGRRPRLGLALGPLKLAVADAVQEIDEEARQQPGAEPDPRDLGQAVHQVEAEGDRDERRERDARRPELSLDLGPRPPQQDDADRDEDEGEERADVAEVGGFVDV